MHNSKSVRKLSGISFDAFELLWDTEFFAVSSAKAVLKNDLEHSEQDALKGFLKEFDFVTISNLNNSNYNNIWIGTETSSFLTDMNVQLIKHIENISNDKEEKAEVFEALSENKRVMQIAKTAFKYSRFYNDPWLINEKAKNVYVHWTECAFAKQDRFFAISMREGEVAGFILFSIDSATLSATIELIAADEAYKGQKVGRSLMAGMESFIHNKGIKMIMTGTQINNSTAIRFYTSCGFKYVKCNSVYHYWPNK